MKPEEIIESVATAPAKALDKALHESEKALHSVSKQSFKQAKGYWHALGPGLTTGASDDDPSGIATYSQVGAQYGYQFLWLAPLTFPLMSFIQEMCARIGMVTGSGLAGNIRKVYSRKVLYVLTIMLLGANIFNIGADLGAMAKASQLLFPSTPFFLLLSMFTVISLGLQIFVNYSQYAKYLKYLALVLLLYIATALTLDNLPWREIMQSTLVPEFIFSKESILLICAVLGTTISPYLFFWQTSQEVEERKFNFKGREQQGFGEKVHPREVKRMRIDVWSGMFLSNLVMFFIIVTCGAVLFPNGINVDSAESAALALQPLAGDQAYTLFALGIIGTGMLAVPVLAGSVAYALAETFNWKRGLNRRLKSAYAFYGVIIIAMGLGMLMNFTGINPIQALIYSAILNGIIAPFILFFVVRLSSNKELMGRWRNKSSVTFIGWAVVLLMTISGTGAILAMLI